jgi:hypothetical protein
VDEAVQTLQREARADGIDALGAARALLGIKPGRVAITGGRGANERFSAESEAIVELAFAPGDEDPAERTVWLNPVTTIDEVVDRGWVNETTRIIYGDPLTGGWRSASSLERIEIFRGWPDAATARGDRLWASRHGLLGEPLRPAARSPQEAGVTLAAMRLLSVVARSQGTDARSLALRTVGIEPGRFFLTVDRASGPPSPASRPVVEFVFDDPGRAPLERLAYATPVISFDELIDGGGDQLSRGDLLDARERVTLLERYPVELRDGWPRVPVIDGAGSRWRLRLVRALGPELDW